MTPPPSASHVAPQGHVAVKPLGRDLVAGAIAQLLIPRVWLRTRFLVDLTMLSIAACAAVFRVAGPKALALVTPYRPLALPVIVPVYPLLFPPKKPAGGKKTETQGKAPSAPSARGSSGRKSGG